MSERRRLAEDLAGLADGDRRVLVLAAAACVRRDLPVAMGVDPYTRTIVETAERWARGEAALDDVRAAHERARKTRGAALVIKALELALAQDAASVARRLAAELPPKLWYGSEAGRAWTRQPGNEDRPFRDSEEATRGIRAVEDQLVTVVRSIAENGDWETTVARHAAIVDRLGGLPPGAEEPRPAGPPVVLVERDRLPEKAATKSDGDPVLIEAIGRHVGRAVAPVTLVYHDRDRRWIHLDVHIVPPAPDRPHFTLITSGMAERPLRGAAIVGRDRERLWTELVMSVPRDWRFGEGSLADPRWYWPIGWLRSLARHAHRTGVGYRAGETIGPLSPAGFPKAPTFDAALFVESSRIPPLEVVGREIRFLAVCPLWPAELQHARTAGARSLREALAAMGHDLEKVEPDRPSVS